MHGTYIGVKHQLAFNDLTPQEQDEHKEWVYNLLFDLYQNEEAYTRELYGEIGWVDDVLTFVKYNANKALQNLGFEHFFEDGHAEFVNPIVLNGISTESNNHDFFSSVGNSYLMGEAEEMEEDDYDF